MIGAIENAIIARIRQAASQNVLGYQLGDVGSYGGQFDGDAAIGFKKFPAVLVTWAREDRPPQYNGAGAWQYFPIFAVMAVALNYRNERSSRHGSDGQVGSFQMLTDLRALLVGQTLGLDIGELEPGRAYTLFGEQASRRKLSVLGFELHTAFEVPLPEVPASDLGDFAKFNADWDIPPHGDFATVPLADGAADATDLVELETQ